jgi:hypothetical protein
MNVRPKVGRGERGRRGVDALNDRFEQRVLALEVVVKRSAAHAGPFEHRLDRRVFVAAFSKPPRTRAGSRRNRWWGTAFVGSVWRDGEIAPQRFASIGILAVVAQLDHPSLDRGASVLGPSGIASRSGLVASAESSMRGEQHAGGAAVHLRPTEQIAAHLLEVPPAVLPTGS